MYRVLGNILCDLDPKVMVKGQILNFLVNASPCSNFKLCRCIGHMMLRALGNILCDLDPKVR